MQTFYILPIAKTLVKNFFANKTWNYADMISCILKKSDGQIIQIYGYGMIGNIGQEVRLVSDQTHRYLGNAVVLGHQRSNYPNAKTYVFK